LLLRKFSVNLAIVTAFIFLGASCSKDASSPINAPNHQFSNASMQSLELYFPDDSLDVAIQEALLDLEEEDDFLGSVSLQRGIWIIETGLNFIFRDQPYMNYEQSADSYSFQIDLASEDQFSLVDIKATLINLYAEINGNISSSKGYIATDVYVEDLTAASILLAVKVYYAVDYSEIEDSWENITLIPSATIGRKAGIAQTCDNSATTGAWIDCAQRARVALRSYDGPPAGSTRFYTNIRERNSIVASSSSNYISPEKLVGNSNAVVSSHQSPVDPNLCLSISDQNNYADAIYSDISGIIVKHSGVISLHVGLFNVGSNVEWGYSQFVYGTNGWTPNLPAIPTYFQN
jgi:hypothetical protein